MKFIVDAQLPHALSDLLNQKGFSSKHTLDLPERNRTKDGQIASLANEEERVVISKDIDFLESYIIKKEPKKLILVKTGNISNGVLLSIFDKNLKTIIHMISRSDLIEIGKTEIAEHGR